MPSNKKKGKARNADRLVALARRAEKNVSVDFLPPFGPVKETHEEAVERILGYKYVSIPSIEYKPLLFANDGSRISSQTVYAPDQPVSVTQKADGNVVIQQLTNDLEPIDGKYIETLPNQLETLVDLLPDYDRNIADYPVAKEIMTRTSQNFADSLMRRVKKCMKDVPPKSMEVYKAFMERGEGIYVKYMKSDADYRLCSTTSWGFDAMHCCEVGLTDQNHEGENQYFRFYLRYECVMCRMVIIFCIKYENNLTHYPQ